MENDIVRNFLAKVPAKRLNNYELLDDEEFQQQLIYFQENYFLNTDVVPFVKNQQGYNLVNTMIYLAPGDSPTKYIDFQKWLNINMRPSLRIIYFPLSGLPRIICENCIEQLVNYLKYYLKGITKKELSKICLVDYIMTGNTKRYLEKAIGRIYDVDFYFSNSINLKNFIDLESVRNSQNTLTRCLARQSLDEPIVREFEDIQIKGHNIFMLLSVFYYTDPDKYSTLTQRCPVNTIILNDIEKNIKLKSVTEQDIKDIKDINSYINKPIKVDITYIDESYEIIEFKNISLRVECDNLIIGSKMIYATHVLKIVCL